MAKGATQFASSPRLPASRFPALRQSQWSKPLNAMLTMRLSKPFALAGGSPPRLSPRPALQLKSDVRRSLAKAG